MDLWIRSHDKKELIKSNRIYQYAGTIYAEAKEDIELGNYKSRERALEVLDEIEKRLKNNVYFKESALELKNGFNKLYIPYEESSQVYQMPEE